MSEFHLPISGTEPIENPLNFGPFGRVYPLEEPEKFIALAPAYYSPFFQWIKE